MQTFREKLDKYIDEYHSTTGISGILRITMKDAILYEKSFGQADREKNIPFTDKSVFTFYSISKPLCTIGLLKLKDRGLVDIDCHPGEYLPEIRGFWDGVTIRHMLHHVSGLPDFVQTAHFPDKYTSGDPSQLKEHLRELTAYPLLFEPGTRGMYANINFILCAMIIENVTGEPYAEYMEREVFSPLGMTAQVDYKGLVIPDRVTGYEMREDVICPVDRYLDWIFGAGDIVGTLDDVYCLNKAIKHGLLLKPETWAEVLRPSPQSSMGMGCAVYDWHGKLVIRHNGGHPGFRTFHMQLPEDDFDIILLSNCSWGNIRNDFSETIYETFYGADGSSGPDIQMDAGYI